MELVLALSIFLLWRDLINNALSFIFDFIIHLAQVFVKHLLLFILVLQITILLALDILILLIIVERNIDWLSILANLNLIRSLLRSNQSILHAIFTLDDSRLLLLLLLLVHHIILSLLCLNLSLEIV